MALKTLSSNQIIYDKGTPANEIALVIKGAVTMLVGTESLVFDVGSFIGFCETPGGTHRFKYMTKGETTIYTYNYTSKDDVIELLKDNEKLSPNITLSFVKNANELINITKKIHTTAENDYNKIKKDLSDYPILCAKTGTESKDYSHLNTIKNPNFKIEAKEWMIEFISTLSSKYKLLSPIYGLGSSMCTGFVVTCIDLMTQLSSDLESIMHSLEAFHKETLEFKNEMSLLSNEATAIESGEETLSMPDFTDTVSQIMLYAGYDEERGIDLKQALDSYSEIQNRIESDDSLRTIRRRIASHFYDLYKDTVLASLHTELHMPPIVKMFLLFGFLDERLVSKEDTEALFGYSCAYRYDGGKIIPIYEWLKKIYNLEVVPSLNEFQQDFQAHLKELVQNGDITKDEMETRSVDPMARLSFEIKNMFTLGNRMTFGRVSIFSPVYDSQARMLPLEKSYLSSDTLTEELNNVRAVDYSIFYRTKIFKMPDNDSIQLFLHKEQIPYIILFPNVGQNMVLWQSIEGRVRNSPSRMLAPFFYEEKLTDSIIRICGEYRWEVCKTEQGVRWTDITDPSLTAEYHDFLQFYKKNSSLSKDHKEKIKTQLKKYSNNYKKVFLNDYLSYVKFESNANMRLLKQVREVLFKYCPFSKDIRESLMTSPQYEKLIETRNNKTEHKTRPLHNLVQKINNQNEEPPAEIIDEINFLES